MIAASVIICSHNPRPEYLRRVLEALRGQTLLVDRWELLLIDNNSDQPLAITWDLSWHPHGRHVVEGKLGLSNARLRGIEEARSDLLVFVDDDNVLDGEYLSTALEIEREWPRLGTWGSGVTVPEFEVQPSTYVSKILPYLALREYKEPRWSNFVAFEATPWGAGLCLRKSVAEAYRKLSLESIIFISDREGSLMLSGGDVELSYLACSMGLGIGTFPKLRLTHLIPQRRLTKDYLLKIVEGTHISNSLLEYKWKDLFPSSPFRFKALLSMLKNLLFLRGIDRDAYLARVRAAIKARQMLSLVRPSNTSNTLSS